MNPRLRGTLINLGILAALVFVVGYLGVWRWMVCRVEVPPGKSLLLTYKGPFPPLRSVPGATEGTLVKLDKKGRPESSGVLEFMPGPGRHFYSPLEYRHEFVDDTIIKPGQLGLVSAKMGKPLPAGRTLAEPGERGPQRRMLTPGRYRIDTKYAYKVDVLPVSACVATNGGIVYKEGDPLLIPAGYVGVVTNKDDNPLTGTKRGTQETVLQPGVYYLNPLDKRVDILSIGFNETTLEVETARNDDGSVRYEEAPVRVASSPTADGTIPPPRAVRDPIYVPNKGIAFQAEDGYPIHLDFTTIWGILPDQAAGVVRQFGSTVGNERNVLKIVESNAVLPAIESICRINGARHKAVDLLVGETREAFQTDTSEELAAELATRDLTLLYGLTRHIYIPARIREPIQQAKISAENTKTFEQKQLTEEAKGSLLEAQARVQLGEQKVKSETEKLVANVLALGEKKSKEIAAETLKLAAEIDAQTAAVQAQITTTLGEAEAKKAELTNQAEAERFQQYVQILGGPGNYNRYMFAEQLPEDLSLGIFHAGPGTLWTDLKGFEQILLGKQAAEAEAAKAAPVAAPTSVRPASALGGN
jgi:hypothetical protein